MVSSGLLREWDLRALTAVVEDGLRDHPGPAMPWTVLDRLQQLIPSDTVGFAHHDLQGSSILTEQVTFDGQERSVFVGCDIVDDPRFWALREKFLPNSYPTRTGDLVGVLRWSDFYTQSDLRNAPFYAEYGNPPVKYHLFVPEGCK